MNRKHLWKLLLILFVVAWSATEIYPPKSRNLVDEFRLKARLADGDPVFQAIVKSALELEAQLPDNSFANLMSAIGTNDVTRYFPGYKVQNEKEPTRAILHRLQREAAGKIKLGLDLQGGTSFLVAMDTNQIATAEDRSRILAQGVEVLRKRVDKFGVAEPLIQPVGEDRILIQLPGLEEAQKVSARNQIRKPAFLEFRLVHERSDELLKDGLRAPGYEVLKMIRTTRSGEQVVESYLVKRKSERGLTGKYIKRASVYRDPVSNEPKISFSFDTEGATIFARITEENVGRLLAIVLDGELYSAPVIREPIRGGNGEISGNFDLKEAFELANVLENPLEAPVQVEQEYSVEASLGSDSIRSGVRAALIGTTLVALFMLAYYLVTGVVANVALMLNILILLGVMCSVGTTLTLPGIAGIVLTIGMAVDANVLIYERIREELAAGKSLRGAISAGYDRAFGTIFDTNLTTLISSIILIFMGTGPVRGFGVTLTIGVAASMFTALVVTRLIIDLLVAAGWIRQLPMLRLIGRTRLNFLQYAKPAFIASWMLILVGLSYGFYRGNSVLGVDFAGGDRMSLTFAPAGKVEVGRLRETVVALKVGEPQIQYAGDIATGSEMLNITTLFGTSDQVMQALQEQFPQAEFKLASLYKAGPSVGQQILKSAIISVLLALFGILVYVAFRYEFSFAVAAVVAVIHDILMTMGWFFLTGRELSAPMVAAVLTIIGFSINDTIVIFDRIREDLKLGVRGSFMELINLALNQTLSRTIITSGTVFLSTLSLYLFGGGVINDFAFTFLVGILTGTYSSIYIAGAMVLWWHKGERPKTAAQVIAEAPEPARA
jgi:SecD/SecF fusion protein